MWCVSFRPNTGLEEMPMRENMFPARQIQKQGFLFALFMKAIPEDLRKKPCTLRCAGGGYTGRWSSVLYLLRNHGAHDGRLCHVPKENDHIDRPNPNGHYVDGPILDMKYKSGVGWLPVPYCTRNDARRNSPDGKWREMAAGTT